VTIPLIKIKVTPKTVVKGKMNARFPSRVAVISPLILDTTGGIYTIGLDGNNAFDTLSPTTSRGDMIYRAATGNARLPVGAANYALLSDGTDPAWTAPTTAFNALAPTTTRGDVIFRNATTNTRLAAGTADYELQSNGAGADPSYAGFQSTLPTTPATRTKKSKLGDFADLRDWNGLDLTGATDNTSLVQDAVTKTAAVGVPLYVPPGVVQLTSAVSWPTGSHIIGAGQAGRETNGAYSYFYFNHLGKGFLTTSESIGDGAGSASRSMKGVNFRRAQPTPGGGWVPNSADYDVAIVGCYDVQIEDCMFLNPTRAILISGKTGTDHGSGRVTLRNIKGQPLLAGIVAEYIYDECFWDEIHFWPHWSFDSNVTNYVLANAVAFQIGRFDGLDAGRIFCYGYALGMNVVTTATSGSLPGGTANLCGFQTFYSDGATTGLLVAGDQSDIAFDRFIQTGNNPAVQSVRVFGSGNKLNFKRMTLFGSTLSGVYVDTGNSNTITIGDYNSLNIDSDSSGDAEFLVVGATNKLRLLASPTTSATNKYSGSGVIESPDWITYTPTVTSGAGSLTTKSAVGRYRRQGKTVDVEIVITITTNGTGSSSIKATVPFTSANFTTVLWAGRILTAGTACTGSVSTSDTLVSIVTYNNTYPGSDGAVIAVSGSYECA
jgi:hypothetical protein